MLIFYSNEGPIVPIESVPKLTKYLNILSSFNRELTFQERRCRRPRL